MSEPSISSRTDSRIANAPRHILEEMLHGLIIDVAPAAEYIDEYLLSSNVSDELLEDNHSGYRSWSPEEQGEYDAMYDR